MGDELARQAALYGEQAPHGDPLPAEAPPGVESRAHERLIEILHGDEQDSPAGRAPQD